MILQSGGLTAVRARLLAEGGPMADGAGRDRRVLENVERIKGVILPSMQPENRATWSPFMPICEKCGNIEHIHIEKLDFLKERNLGDICHVQINVTGVCKKCVKQ